MPARSEAFSGAKFEQTFPQEYRDALGARQFIDHLNIMARRKKRNYNFNWIVAGLAVGVFAWIASDFYFNVYRHPQEKADIIEVADNPETESAPPPEQISEESAPASEDGFVLATYRDDRWGLELRYPTVAGDARCPSPQKTEDGFSLGNFYFFAGSENETLEDFMARQLQGMEVESRENINAAGRPAVKTSYQTPKAGLYGSSVFLENNGWMFEFGLLAKEAAEKCGGADDYDERLYQSVISTLEFAD